MMPTARSSPTAEEATMSSFLRRAGMPPAAGASSSSAGGADASRRAGAPVRSRRASAAPAALSNTTSTMPKVMTSPGWSVTGWVPVGSPLTSVPLALPRSRTTTPPGVASTSACLRLTESSSSTTVAGAWRPTTSLPCTGNFWLAHGPVSPLSTMPPASAPSAGAAAGRGRRVGGGAPPAADFFMAGRARVARGLTGSCGASAVASTALTALRTLVARAGALSVRV